MLISSKKSLRAFVTGMMIGLMVYGFASTAYAGIATGSNSVASGCGYTHRAYNMIHTYTSNGVKRAKATTGVLNNQTIPSGYVGVIAKLHNGSGALVKESSWTYNPIARDGWGSNITQDSASGERYSEGAHKVWQGSSYTTHGTFRSPSQSVY